MFGAIYSWAQCTYQDSNQKINLGSLALSSFTSVGTINGTFSVPGGAIPTWILYGGPYMDKTINLQVQIAANKSACIYLLGHNFNTNSNIVLEDIYIGVGTCWAEAFIDFSAYPYQKYYIEIHGVSSGDMEITESIY
jgi:hypothetical protein